MIASGLVLFLFGTAVSAGPYMAPSPTEIVISKNKHASAENIVEYYPSSGQSPFISNFIQKGTNVFFKPQFMLSASQLPQQIQPMIAAIQNDDCKTSYPMGPVPVMPIIEEPLRVIEKEFIAPPAIKEVIDINPMPYPMVMPQLPLVVEEPCEVGPTYVPTVEIPVPPVVVEVKESKTPLVIPPAPVLPPMVMPKIPMIVEKVPFVAPVPEVPVVFETEKSQEIVMSVVPPAPVLPPMEIPQMPVLVEEPCAPVEVIKHAVIPEAPVLPAYVPKPYIHEVLIEEKPVAAPQPPLVLVEEKVMPEFYETVEVVEHAQPMVIPEAPVLPPLAPVEIPAPVIIEEPLKPMMIPSAPVLRPIELPKVPFVEPCETVEIVEKHVQPMLVPGAPLLPPMAPMAIPAPFVVAEPIKPAFLPSAPLLPPVEMIKKPAQVLVAPCPPEDEVVVMPVMPKLPEVYTPYASQHLVEPCEDIVVERILPKMKMDLRRTGAKTALPMHFAPLGYGVL